ncbi:Nucleolar GTP-binding protein 1 [Saccharomyces pastorianus]|nr:Nucleolar GTP-binding protein 1 [Saccharomyces pastorianus]
MPRSKLTKSFGKMEEHMSTLGHDMSTLQDKQKSAARKNRYVERGSDVVFGEQDALTASTDNGIKLRQTDRLLDGVADGSMRSKADRIVKMERRDRNRHAKQGESDRHNPVSLSKHLFSGKRGVGKTDFR